MNLNLFNRLGYNKASFVKSWQSSDGGIVIPKRKRGIALPQKQNFVIPSERSDEESLYYRFLKSISFIVFYNIHKWLLCYF